MNRYSSMSDELVKLAYGFPGPRQHPIFRTKLEVLKYMEKHQGSRIKPQISIAKKVAPSIGKRLLQLLALKKKLPT